MPINLPNFLGAETSSYGLPHDLIQNAMEGYKASRLPRQLRQEEEQRALYNRLLGHQGTHAEQVNQYYPKTQEQLLEKGDVDIEKAMHDLEISKKYDALKNEASLASALSSNKLSEAKRKRLEALISPEMSRYQNQAMLDNLKMQKALLEIQKLQNPASKQQEELQKQLGKDAAKVVSENNTAIIASEDVESSLNELLDIANSNPRLFDETVGPYQGRINKYSGSPEQKEMLGAIKSAQGKITFQTLALLKGASSDLELNEVKEIQPSYTDFPEVYRKKAHTLLKIADQAKKRRLFINEQIEAGVTPTQAVKNSQKQFPITTIISQAKKEINQDSKIDKELEEIDKKLASMK